jgi:hypothetical protein
VNQTTDAHDAGHERYATQLLARFREIGQTVDSRQVGRSIGDVLQEPLEVAEPWELVRPV